MGVSSGPVMTATQQLFCNPRGIQNPRDPKVQAQDCKTAESPSALSVTWMRGNRLCYCGWGFFCVTAEQQSLPREDGSHVCVTSVCSLSADGKRAFGEREGLFLGRKKCGCSKTKRHKDGVK